MPLLLLFRTHALTSAEQKRLPVGFFSIPEDDERFLKQRLVAQAHVRASIAVLLKMAFELGKAIPDARFGYEEGFSHQHQETAFTEVEESIEDSSDEESSIGVSIEEDTSWISLVERGAYTDALEALSKVLPITQEDQIVLSRLFASKESDKMIFVCDAAIRFLWKSMALKLRAGLRHQDSRVRCASVKAIGVLAGPSLSPAIQIMLNDPDESVRNAAAKSLKKMKNT